MGILLDFNIILLSLERLEEVQKLSILFKVNAGNSKNNILLILIEILMELIGGSIILMEDFKQLILKN